MGKNLAMLEEEAFYNGDYLRLRELRQWVM